MGLYLTPGSEYLEPDDGSEWVECEYCAADPRSNSSFYCEECCGLGGRIREDDYYDEPWSISHD